MAKTIRPRKWITQLEKEYDPAMPSARGGVILLSGLIDDLIFQDAQQPGVTLTQFLLARYGESVDAFAWYRHSGRNGTLTFEFNNTPLAAAPAPVSASTPPPEAADDVLGDLNRDLTGDAQTWLNTNRGRSTRTCNPQDAIRSIHELLESRTHRSIVVFENIYWQIQEDDVLGLLMEWPNLCRKHHHLVVLAMAREDIRWITTCFPTDKRGVRALTVDGPTPDEVKALLVLNALREGKDFFDWLLLDELAEVLAKNIAQPGEGYGALFSDYLPNLLEQGMYLDRAFIENQPRAGQKAQEVHLDDLILKPSERARLEYLLRAWRDPDWRFREAERLNVDPSEITIPIRMLLYGPPGTGKTTIAKMIATESNRAFFSVTPADFTSEYRGGPLLAVRRHFREWRANAPCVVFWDEVEATASRRDTAQHSDNPINQILTELEGTRGRDEGIMIICATNIPEQLDPAFRRRFKDGELLIGYPDQAGREQLVRKYFKIHLLETDLRVEDIGRWFEQRPPSDFEACARACRFELSQRGERVITRAMITRWLAANPIDRALVQRWQKEEEQYQQRIQALGIG